MNTYIENSLPFINKLYKNSGPGDALAILFTVLGTGLKLNNQGFLTKNYNCKDIYDYGDPHPLQFIYQFSDNDCAPFNKLKGCRDIGFKESVLYFIECIKVTPDSIKDIKQWKDNIHKLIELANAPLKERAITDKNDIDKFFDLIKDSNPTSKAPLDGTELSNKNSVYKVWFFDVQWSDCPSIIQNEIRDIWNLYELGNDNYFYSTELDDTLFEKYPLIYMWLKHKGVSENEKVLVHWWW